MKRIRVSLLAVILCLAVLAGTTPAADPTWKFVIRVAGVVQCRKADQPSWVSIWNGRLLNDNDSARTLEKSRAKILLPDDSFFVLGQKTTISLARIEYTPKSRYVELRLTGGKLRVQVQKFATRDNSFKVVTPRAVLAARGTEWYEEQDPLLPTGEPGVARWYVFSGFVDVTTQTGTERFGPGEGGSVDTSNRILHTMSLAAAPAGAPAQGADPDTDLASPGAHASQIGPNNPYLPVVEPPPFIVNPNPQPNRGTGTGPTGPSITTGN